MRRARAALEGYHDLLPSLDARSLKILQLRAEGYSLARAGRIWHISATRVGDLEQGALARLRTLHLDTVGDTPEGFYRYERFGDCDRSGDGAEAEHREPPAGPLLVPCPGCGYLLRPGRECPICGKL